MYDNKNKFILIFCNNTLYYTIMYGLKNSLLIVKITIVNFFSQRLFIELFYNRFISEVVLNLGGQSTKILDKGSVEYLGPYGLEMSLTYIGNKLSRLDSGLITSYGLYILVGLVLYIFILSSIITNELLLIVLINLIFLLKK